MKLIRPDRRSSTRWLRKPEPSSQLSPPGPLLRRLDVWPESRGWRAFVPRAALSETPERWHAVLRRWTYWAIVELAESQYRLNRWHVQRDE